MNGVLLTLFALAVGAIVAFVYFVTVGGSIDPPTPMLAQSAFRLFRIFSLLMEE